jgi:hypothetical protein
LHVLRDFFVAAMEVTDIRGGFSDGLAIHLQNEPQNAVRGRVRRPHVEHHFFADVAKLFVQLRVRRGHARDRIRGFDFARAESHKPTLRLCSREAREAQAQSRSWFSGKREPI